MVLDYSNLSVSLLSASGIVWDISGAVALSKGLFFVSDEKLRLQAAAYWGSNPSAIRAFCEQRLDTRFGLLQLLGGFILQACSALGVTIDLAIAGLIVAPILIVWWVYASNYQYWVLSAALRMRRGNEASAALWRKHFADVPERTWHAVIWNDGVIFDEDERKKARPVDSEG